MSVGEIAQEIEGSEPYIYVMKKREDGKCVFLRDKSCEIYAIRPLVCRFYPFTLKSLRKNSYIFDYTEECPGIGGGSELKKSFFEMLFREAQRYRAQ